MRPPLAPFYHDPLDDMLSSLEDSVELWRDPQMTFWAPDACFMDPVAGMLNELEASIEDTTVPPLRPFGAPDPPPVMPGPPAPIVYGSFDQHPPASQEPWEKPWGMIEPPPAARLFYTHCGLTDRSYHPQFGGGTGVRGETTATSRWCPEQEEAVEQTACACCGKWGDHGAGIEQCYYDWRQEEQDREGDSDEAKDAD